jgi:hypothetical protein
LAHVAKTEIPVVLHWTIRASGEELAMAAADNCNADVTDVDCGAPVLV